MRLRRTNRHGRDPEPQAIDPASGFKVPLSNLVRQWDNELIDRRFVDKRNPQDFVRGVTDNQALPEARPEVPNIFLAESILTEAGVDLFTETLIPIFEEGAIVSL